MPASIVRDIQQRVAATLAGDGAIVLAVSGGVDSMALLDAAAEAVPRDRLCVATFDHGTGPAASESAALVREVAGALGVECVNGRASGAPRSEAALRDARWTFLRAVAAKRNAVVATAHTLDDQIETVFMRVLRGAGARGLAALHAPGDVLRPLLPIRRRQVLRYARARRLAWIEDPSNASLMFLRNRVRHELLPALCSAAPALEDDLLEIARAAAVWRTDVAMCVDHALAPRLTPGGGAVDAPAERLRHFAAHELKVLWPEIAARAGVALDRRGTERLAEFTHDARVGARVQLSGGWEVVRSRDAFQLRASALSRLVGPAALRGDRRTRWDDWAFRRIRGEPGSDAWSAWLPREATIVVRRWQPGDVMLARADGQPRKVKYFLSDAGITGHERRRWPVVLAGDQIVWIPGVRRSAVATARSGGPALAFACEYVSR